MEDTSGEAGKNHHENLKRLLDRARQVNLKLNNKKMNLKKTEVGFMGHVLSKDGLKPDPGRKSESCHKHAKTNKKETESIGFC